MPAHQTSRMLPLHRQRGAVLMLLLLLAGVGALAVFVSGLNRAAQQQERDRISSEALARAKDALIGYAVTRDLSGITRRPGDLPCPDLHPQGDFLEGTPSAPCNGDALGRLPWKTLGLPDLRDGSGERLWYAISVDFKDNLRIGTLNSDTIGTITVRDPSGAIVNDGANLTGAISVIIAPGSILKRQDGIAQVRGAVGYGVATNYLDIGGGEDNANFVNSNTNGFIQGFLRDSAQTIVLNDRLITITPNDLMPTLEKRVAREVLSCLTEYAAKPENQGRHPWAAPLNPLGYSDLSGTRFGRVPDTPFTNTKSDSGVSTPMDDSWTGNCNINSSSGWWLNWKELVFFAVADAFKPVNLDASPVPAPGCGVTGTCLTFNPPFALANKQVGVFVAGRLLGSQARVDPSDKGDIVNYLEGQNSTPLDDVFERNLITSSFNDVIIFAP